MTEAPGVPGYSIADVVEWHGHRLSCVEPVACLIDGSQMSLIWIGIRDEELEPGVFSQASHDHTDGPGLGVAGELVREPQPSEGEAIGRCGTLDQAMSIGRSDAQGECAQESGVEKDPEGKACATWQRVEVVI